MNNTGQYTITLSTYADLNLIFSFFDSAIRYQQKKGYDLWPQFSRQMIESEIQEGGNRKIMEGNTCVAVFSVLYSDEAIWKEKNMEPAVYLHRIAVNPLFKGRGLMQVVRQWAIAHAKALNKKYVRMDTWGKNKNLREYYIRCGFPYIGQQYLDETAGKPVHYGGSELSLFQIEV